MDIKGNKNCNIVINKNLVSLEQTGDEMFEELDYEKNEQEYMKIKYKLKEDNNEQIIFDLEEKTFTKLYFVPFESEPVDITMKELKAIIKKVRELKWI